MVELEEAQALAKEIALAAPGGKVERPLPVYLLGEYRHEGKGKDRTITLKMRAERGGKPVGEPLAAALKADAAPGAVREWSAGVLDGLARGGRPRPPADAKAEAKQLADRARTFKRLGNSADSLAPGEASLLLDPAQPGLHADAVRAVTDLIRPIPLRSNSPKGLKGDVADYLALYTRGLAHVEAFIAKGGDPADTLGISGVDLVREFRVAALLNPPGHQPPALRDALREMIGETRAACLRMIPVLAARGKGQEVPYVWWAVMYLPPKEKYDTFAEVPLASPGTAGGAVGLSTVCFDGKYVWAAMPELGRNPVLLALDPASEKVWELHASDGFPRAPEKELADKSAAATVMAAALEPGRACLAGSFLGRAWVGVCTLDATAGKGLVKVIHEARDAQDRADYDQWNSATVTFDPSLIVTITGPPAADGKPARRVLVGRGRGENLGVGQYLLVVDPDEPKVTVLDQKVPGWPNQPRCSTCGDAVYFNALTPNRNTEVVRVGGVPPAKEVIAPRLPATEPEITRLFAHGGRVHVVLAQVEARQGKMNQEWFPRYRWWTMDADGKNPRQVATDLPAIWHVAVSSHFGLVALVKDEAFHSSTPAALCALSIDEPKK